LISFTIPGDPKPQQRPRFFRRGNFVGTYDPKESTDFKSKAAFFAKQSGITLLDGPISLEIDVFVKRPKNRCGKKFPPLRIPCSSRPDCDNFAKGVMDALNGIAWHDDGQIQDLRVRKFYHEIGGSPRTEVSIFLPSEIVTKTQQFVHKKDT